MPRALWGQPELWSVCGAERLEEWVLVFRFKLFGRPVVRA
jgi:hypothetical protein